MSLFSIVPPLKKVKNYQEQLEKMRQWTFKLAKMDMRGGLKPVKKEIELDEKLVKKIFFNFNSNYITIININDNRLKKKINLNGQMENLLPVVDQTNQQHLLLQGHLAKL